MYLFSLLIVLCCLILHAVSRPSRVLEDYDKESKEDSYGDSYGSDSDGYINRQKSSLKQFSDNEPNTKIGLQDENFSNTDDEIDRGHPDKDYLENSEDVADEDQGEIANSFHNDMLSTGNEGSAEYNKGNNIIFQNKEKLRNVHDSKSNEDENVGQSENIQYFKQYNAKSNTKRDALTADKKRFDNEHDSINRDRRQIKNLETDESIGTEEISTQTIDLGTNEDEETAIKRHIKKLSKEELNELINSLSEDKRALLQNIIDNSRQEYDSINKREITKKAGVNDENSFVGSEQSDTNKIQGGSANIQAESSMAPNSEDGENTKKVESETMCSKTTEIVSSSEKPNDKVSMIDVIEDIKLEKSDNKDNLEAPQKEDKIQDNTDKDEQISKNQKKREMDAKYFLSSNSESKVNEPEISSPLNNEDLYCSENDDMSQLWNEESSLYNNDIKKREIKSNNERSMKSLEDSFPNGDDASNFKPGSDMVPLVRVKRKNFDKVVHKRDGNIISNLKVPFFSNAVENNEEDSDEGSEFQDDGFFDRRTNFAKSNELNRRSTDSSKYDDEDNSKNFGYNSQTFDADNNNLESDTVSLGSDTDAVLSGIEGVDDNIMYNGVSRNKRTADVLNNSLNNESENEKCRQTNTAVSENEMSEEIDQLSPRYQENDAFGSLPRNYEEDLGRFKRIRRLKPLLDSKNNALALKQ